MKPIPLILIVAGGVMIFAGINKENPVTVVKNVLTGNAPVASITTTDTGTTATPSPTIAPATPPGLFGQVITSAGN